MTIALYIIEICAYTIFGSGEEQPWNKSQARELMSVNSQRGGENPLLNSNNDKNSGANE